MAGPGRVQDIPRPSKFRAEGLILAAMGRLGTLLLLAALGAGTDPAPIAAAELARGEVLPDVPCDGFPGQTYALYLPASFTPERRWPILYIFDPRGRGAQAAELFRAAAERRGWIVASSNNSRSDTVDSDPNTPAVRALWADTHRRFTIDPQRVYATGFSGGARVAALLGFQRPGEVAGVIGVGGGLPHSRQPDQPLPFAFFGLAGIADFNYAELRALEARLAGFAAGGAAHALESFEGGHEWAPPERLGDAVEWLEVLAMRRGALERGADFLATRRETHRQRIDALAAAGDPLAALARGELAIAELDGLADVGPLAAEVARLRADPALARAADEERREAAAETAYEQRVRLELRFILGEDPESLNAQRVLGRLEVPRLQREVEKGASLYARRGARRSLETLFVQVAYYMPRELERRGDPARAAALLDIAAAIHPEAPRVWFELARQRALAGQSRKALAALRRAVDSGYADAAALAGEPAFARLRGQPEYQEIAARLAQQPEP